MKLLIDGQAYEYDGSRMAMAEAMEMQERTGYGLLSFETAFEDLKPTALKWMAYLAKQRAGERVEWSTFTFDLAAMVSDLFSSREAEEELDPTKPTSPPSEPPGE